MISRLRRLLRSELFSLYCVQFSTYLLPLVTIPFLARRLGPSSWGLVAYFQAMAMCLALVVEFGFGLSATRAVARRRESLTFRSDMISAVIAAKLLLSGAVAGIGVLLGMFLPQCRQHPWMLGAAIAFAVAQGSNMVWYYQGLGRTSVAASADVVGRGLATVLIFAFVAGPADAWKPLCFWALGSVGSTAVTLTRAWRQVPFRAPSFRLAIDALRDGFALFLFRSAVSIYVLGNSFVLGNFAEASSVGYYAGAERIGRGVLALLQPMNMDMYAQVSHAMARGMHEAARVHLRFLRMMGGASLLVGAAVFALAEPMVHILLGPNFEPAIAAVRLFALLPPAVALANSLGANWMVPLRLDRPFTAIVAAASALDLLLAATLAPRWQHLGMCFAVTSTEVFVALAFYIYLRARGCDPFTAARQPAPAEVAAEPAPASAGGD
jgi:PST family polysaccharide transporter